MIKIGILLGIGIAKDGTYSPDDVSHYEFNTMSDAQIFIDGVDAAIGFLEYSIVKAPDELTAQQCYQWKEQTKK